MTNGSGMEDLSHRIAQHEEQIAYLETKAVRYGALFEAMPQGVALTDANGAVVEINAAAARILGCRPEVLGSRGAYGQGWRVVGTDRSDLPREKWPWVVALEHRQPSLRQRIGIDHGDGSLIWVDVSAVPVSGQGGVVVTYDDVTEQFEATEEIRYHQEMSLRTEEIAQLGTWQWDVANDRVTWSGELFRIFGRDPADGAPSYADHPSIYPPADMARLDALVRRAVEDGEPFETELEALRPDGTTRHCRARGIPRRGSSGRIEYLYGFMQDIHEQHLAQQELMKVSHDRAVILDNVPAYIFFKDNENNIISISRSVAEVTGLPMEEIVGRHSSEIYPDMADKYWADDLEVIRSGRPKIGIVEPLPTADGRERWLLTDKIPYFEDNGQVHGIIVMATDITERVEAEKRLQESESKFRSLFEFAGDAIYLTRMDGRFVDVNVSALKQTGYTREELLNMGVHDLDRRAASEDDRSAIWDHLHPGDFAAVQTRHRRKDGSTFPVEVSISVMEVQNERLMVGFVRDVTEKNRMLEDLRQSEERLSLAFQGANDGLWDWNLNTDEVFYSPRWKSMLGYEDHEIENHLREWERLVDDDDRRKAWQALDSYIKGETPGFECELRMRHKDGRWIDVLSRAFAIRDEKTGEPIRVVGTHVDITERNEMQRHMLQVQRLESLGNLAGGIAHDFNNILHPIMGLSELLMQDLPSESRGHRHAREIFGASLRGRDLVERILTISRPSEGKLAPTRLQDILRECVKMARATIPANIQITHSISDDCGMVEADNIQIHQVVMNFLTNAYHAVGEANGHLRLGLDSCTLEAPESERMQLEAGDYARISVSDDGCGIAPENLDKIFEPYFTTKVPGRGTGIGLSTVYSIVKRHSGAIQVNSELNRGSTFEVYLPLAAMTLEMPKPGIEDAMVGGTERIILVDDDPTIAELERHVLERLGYQVTALTSSEEFLGRFTSDPFGWDMVLTDMTMPGLTGDQLAREIHSIRSDIPVVCCTGHSDRITAEGAEDLGFCGVLLKPVSGKDLARKIREVLDEVRSGDR